MFKRTVSLAIAFLLPTIAFAQSINTIDDRGDWSDDVWIYMDQIDGGGTATVYVDPWSGSSLVIAVNGAANTLDRTTLGVAQSGTVLQHGDGNLVRQEQVGAENRADVVQVATAGSLEAAGATSGALLKAALVAGGRRDDADAFWGNIARQRQYGTSLAANVRQVGWENDGDAWQVGDGHVATFKQQGEYNTGWLDQIGADQALELQQQGSDNGAIVIQTSNGSRSSIVQSGLMNLAFVSQ